MLRSFHQKVNYPIIPAEVLNTALADLYEEGKKPTNKAIAKRIIDDMLAKVRDDIAWLSVNGQYDAAHAYGEFGKSMDGVEQAVKNAVAHADHPAYKIPLNALTDTNIVDEITTFERKLPAVFKSKVTTIFMSENNAERYALRYEELYGANTTYRDGDKLKTRLGKREIVGLPGLSDDVVFATPKGNLLKLIDVFDNPPAVTDVQVQDYKVKIFSEFHLGYDFAINEFVMVANFTDTAEGTGDAARDALYYPHK